MVQPHPTFKEVKEVIVEISSLFDYKLIDSPTGIESGFIHAATVATESVILTNTTVIAIQDADRVIGILEDLSMPDIRLIINIDFVISKPNRNSESVIKIVNKLQVPLLIC